MKIGLTSGSTGVFVVVGMLAVVAAFASLMGVIFLFKYRLCIGGGGGGRGMAILFGSGLSSKVGR